MDSMINHDLRSQGSSSNPTDKVAYPDHPGVRRGSPETSHEAAADIAPKLGRLQRMVSRAVEGRQSKGLTPEEAADLLKMDRVSLQPRFSELKAKGLIVDSGQRRTNPSSRKRAVVWVAAAYAPTAGEQIDG